MHLKQLTLTQYKNFSSKTFNFDPNINCFVGDNGVGKSNILDAIYHLSFCKSYFNPISLQNIQIGNDFFVIKGLYEKNLREEKIICSFKKGQKKIVKRNGKLEELDYTKLIIQINKHVTINETLAIIENIKKEINERFDVFYPNTDNMRDIVEKHIYLYKNDLI